jgi:hypothetical protein
LAARVFSRLSSTSSMLVVRMTLAVICNHYPLSICSPWSCALCVHEHKRHMGRIWCYSNVFMGQMSDMQNRPMGLSHETS